MEYEKDTISILQSVFLMGYYFDNSDSLTGPWYWNGIAISMSQNIGLHRSGSIDSSDGLGSRPIWKPRWKRLWWSIYCREVWYALGFGRPMRLTADDITATMPVASEFASYAPQNCDGNYARLFPKELKEVYGLWISFVTLTSVLGKILCTQYVSKDYTVDQDLLPAIEDEITRLSRGLPSAAGKNEMVQIHVCQLSLYHEYVISQRLHASATDYHQSLGLL